MTENRDVPKSITPRVTYHHDTDTLAVAFAHRESDGVSSWTSSHNTGWEMTLAQWTTVLKAINDEVDRVTKGHQPDPAELAGAT